MATQPFAQMQTVMRRYANNVRNNTRGLVADVSVAAAVILAEETPVDTGQSRSNWNVSIGAPNNVVYSAYAPGSHLGKAEVGNLAGVRAQARHEASVYRAQRGDSFPPMFIVNNVPWIGALDQGYSQQAAPGMVQRALQIVSAFAKSRVRSLLIAAGARPT